MATTKITNPELFDLGSLDTALQLPSGTTAERPTSPSTGEWRYNTDNNLIEFYDGGSWRDLQSEEPLIPSENFNVVTFTGNNAASQFIDVGFTPDFVWIKPMPVVASHALYDSTRGDNNRLSSNSTGAQSTVPNEIVTNGFNVIGGHYNDSVLGTMVAWCWKANGGTTSSNTDGTITSTVQANNAAGFSVVQYTGTGSNATVGHGLSAAPEMMIIKSTSAGGSSYPWGVYHTGIGPTKYLELNFDNAAGTASTPWNDTAPTSTIFNLGSWSAVNGSVVDYIAYCFHSVAGYSKFGSYTGNGSTNGPIVNTGFEPAYVMIKRTDAIDDWIVVDNKRNTTNSRYNYLMPNSQAAENGSASGTINPLVNFLSNGFQIAATWGAVNNNGSPYIYIAFAADPSAAPVLADSFNTTIYTGNSGTQALSGYGFTPSMIWFKARTVAFDHGLYDSVRGGTSLIYPSLSQAASTVTNGIQSFDADGVTVGANNKQNDSSSTYVGWAWKANSIPTINTDGTIQSVVSANQAAGFSIVRATIPANNTTGSFGHGLSAAPELIIQKGLDTADVWLIYNKDVGTNKYLQFTTAAEASFTGIFANVGASTITTLYSATTTVDTIHYCFHSVDGYSKIGSYTGNGSATGPVITTGFQPDFVMIKSTSIAGAWMILDSARSPSNPRQLLLQPQSAAIEQNVGNAIDFNADNFQITDTNASRNQNGATYIYMAFKIN